MFKKGEQCSERISDYTGYHRSQCSRKAVVQREGKPYCKIHDPEYIKAKRDASHKQYDDEAAKREADRQRLVVISGIFRGIETTQVEQDANKYKAAPELYEACKALLRLTEGDSGLADEREYAKQAIAKVKEQL